MTIDCDPVTGQCDLGRWRVVIVIAVALAFLLSTISYEQLKGWKFNEYKKVFEWTFGAKKSENTIIKMNDISFTNDLEVSWRSETQKDLYVTVADDGFTSQE